MQVVPGSELLSFDAIRSALASSQDSKVVQVIDAAASIAILLSPAVLGPGAGIAAAGLLEVKGELSQLAKDGLSVIDRSRDQLGSRYAFLSGVHTMSCFTAFFEAADQQLNRIRREFRLNSTERMALTQKAIAEYQYSGGKGKKSEERTNPLGYRIELPHPTRSLQESGESLRNLYTVMSSGLERFIMGLEAWESAREPKRERINALILDLPKMAQDIYRDQYLMLCRDYNEFYVWAMLEEHELTRAEVKAGSDDVKAILEIVKSEFSKVDLGLEAMKTAFASLKLPARSASIALENLNTLYTETVDEPIILDEMSNEDQSELTYPRKSEIFIPQCYRALRYGSESRSLEDNAAWQDTEPKDSISRFLLSVLSNPASERTPILILGHPGSGKSLLTQVFAARLMTSLYTPIRVELRDINADSSIQSQIEEQVRRDTGTTIDWPALVDECGDRPPVVILDGYDELLQASGQVHSTYLTQAADFQAREKRFGRATRVLITSRVTLIDKAEIPVGSTVIRLEDFTPDQKMAWVSRWNLVNASFFSSNELEPFVLPQSQSLADLANQPLLLLMLALYDSEGNRLRADVNLNQTSLYDSLLRRFIDREHRKGENGREYVALGVESQRSLIEEDMARLGVAAVGMFNRKQLHVSKDDLDQDIRYFSVGRSVPGLGAVGTPLGQAELLLGSFFFVHESRSRVHEAGSEPGVGHSAFEFLHNTFGEFLVADFLLREIIKECQILRSLGSDQTLATLRRDRVAGGLPERLLAALMFTPLYTRPMVLQMFSEWASTAKASSGTAASDYWPEMDAITLTQCQSLLSNDSMPPMLLGQSQHPFPRLGFLQHGAILTLNLVLLRLFLTGSLHLGDEWGPASDRWDRVTSVWKAAIGRSELEGFGAVVAGNTSGRVLELRVRGDDVATRPGSLTAIFRTAQAMGDNLLEGLSGWALQSSPGYPDLDYLMALPAMRTCGFVSDMSERQVMRNVARGGIAVIDPENSLPDGRRPRIGMAGIGGRVLTSRGFVGSIRTATNFPPEIAALHPNLVGSFRHADTSDLNDFVTTRSAAAASAIFMEREMSESRWLDDGSTDIDDSPDIAAYVVDGMRAGRKDFAGEVALEAILTGPDPQTELLSRWLEEGLISPWVIAERPVRTFRRLLKVAQDADLYSWVDHILNAFVVDGRRIGPTLVRSLGLYRTLTVLEIGARRGLLSEPLLAELDGIVSFALANCEPDESGLSLASLLRVYRLVEPWSTNSPGAEGLLAIFAAEPIEDYLPSSAVDDWNWYLLNHSGEGSSGSRRTRRRGLSPRETEV